MIIVIPIAVTLRGCYHFCYVCGYMYHGCCCNMIVVIMMGMVTPIMAVFMMRNTSLLLWCYHVSSSLALQTSFACSCISVSECHWPFAHRCWAFPRGTAEPAAADRTAAVMQLS